MREVKMFFNELTGEYVFDVIVREVTMEEVDWDFGWYLGQVEYTDGSWLDIFYQFGELIGVEHEPND